MKIEYPTITDKKKIFIEAREYAFKSAGFTMDYDDFRGNGDRSKVPRIFIGVYGQSWVKRYCELNSLPVVCDNTDYKTPDEYDLRIAGSTVEVKTTTADLLQVTPNRSVLQPEHYCFLGLGHPNIRLDDLLARGSDLSYIVNIIPFGIISVRRYRELCTVIQQGEIIPGTPFENKFRQTTILEDRKQLINFENGLFSLLARFNEEIKKQSEIIMTVNSPEKAKSHIRSNGNGSKQKTEQQKLF